MIQIQYDDLMDIIASAYDLNESCTTGTIRVHMDMLNGIWNELRKMVYEYRATGKAVNFNYAVLQSKYMRITCKLSDYLQPISNSRSESLNSNNNQISLPKIELPKFLVSFLSFDALLNCRYR